MARYEQTQAFRRFARKYLYSVSTVRHCTTLRREALAEYRAAEKVKEAEHDTDTD